MRHYSIYINPITNDYYVEIQTLAKPFEFKRGELPNLSYRKDLLRRIDVLPFSNRELEEKIKKFLSRDRYDYSSVVDELEFLVEEYNDNLKSISQYFQFTPNEKFISIDTISRSLNKIYDQDEDKVNFALLKNKINELKNKAYRVYQCNNCNQFFYSNINQILTCPKCKCELRNDALKKVFTGPNAYSLAIKYVESANKETNNQSSEKVAIDKPFYYRGQAYGITFPDYKSLHEIIYRYSDYDAIMHLENDEAVFNPEYLEYIECLRAASVINNDPQLEGRDDLMAELYGYLWKNKIIQFNSLIWNGRTFITTLDYINALIKDSSLLPAFNEDTCEAFFKIDFDYRKLSMKIYELTKRFVYVSAKEMIDYGKYFFEELLNSTEDEVLENKLFFIDFIRGYDSEYFNLFQNDKYKRIENYFSVESNGHPYPIACDYYYNIFGEIRYYSLSFKKFDDVSSINKIITSAYKSRDGGENYKDLYSLIMETNLLYQAFGHFYKDDVCYIDQIRELMDDKKCPSIKLYLYCLNSISKSTGIFYERFSTLDDILESIVSVNNDNMEFELDLISKNDDVNYFIDKLVDKKVDVEYLFPDVEKNKLLDDFDSAVLKRVKENSINRKVKV